MEVVVDEEDNVLCGDLVHWNDLVVRCPDGCTRPRNPRKLVLICQCECMM